MIGGGVPFGAEQRLLPEWIPLSFFAFSLICLPLGWVLVFIQADQLSSFNGGFGPVAATLHMFTLGVILTTAFGASMQMLPVAIGANMKRPSLVVILLALISSGIAVLLGGFAHYLAPVSFTGSLLLGGGVLVYIILLISLLLRAQTLRLVRTHAFWAAGFLCLITLLGLMMITEWNGLLLFPLHNTRSLHGGFALYGFMGLLVFGFSRIMIPMLSVSDKTNDKLAKLALIISVIALGFWGAGWQILAPALGLTASLLHVYELAQVLKARLRTRLGPEWLLIRLSWSMLPLSLLLFLIAQFQDSSEALIRLSICIGVIGWLLSFVLGILQRIIPFLLSMQIARKTGMPELPSKLAHEKLLKTIGPLHLISLSLLSFGLFFELTIVIQLSALVGFIYASLFGAFFVTALKRKQISLDKMTS